MGFLLLLEVLVSSVVKPGDALVCGHSLLPLCSNSWMGDSVLFIGGDADEGSTFLGSLSFLSVTFSNCKGFLDMFNIFYLFPASLLLVPSSWVFAFSLSVQREICKSSLRNSVV